MVVRARRCRPAAGRPVTDTIFQQVSVQAISAPPRPGGKNNDAIQDLSSGPSSGGYTNTNQELRRIVPDAKGRTVVRPRCGVSESLDERSSWAAWNGGDSCSDQRYLLARQRRAGACRLACVLARDSGLGVPASSLALRARGPPDARVSVPGARGVRRVGGSVPELSVGGCAQLEQQAHRRCV